ncbi:PREDICTED: TBC1 domain family member 14-like [Nicrophorus vespilloides]|uniref:TBC1 domain family member 14-like n=1 Tax=Nicrophorus vespilloides TaxID=110193 RepID=A0ABM1MHQ3_NICVS|nr:PREDICTED: TBC1 domain family member 14-like [Nicrophorus vespilloides]
MKTLDPDNEASSCLNPNNLLIESKALLKCNSDLAQSYNVLKQSPMGHKGQYYESVLSKSGVVTQDSRSHSLPNDLDEKNKMINGNSDNYETCDINTKLLNNNESPPHSPTQDLWFKTWPERCEKIKCNDAETSQTCDKIMTNQHKVTLNEALQNISLAYSPVTKQLHLVHNEQQSVEAEHKKPGHKRNDPGSFSSTLSSLSDASQSGSLLDSEGRSSPASSESGAKPKTKKSLGNFFNKNVFSSNSVWKIFSKTAADNPGSPQHQNVVVSSAALIQHMRPSNLPAKTEEEELRHREQYKAIVAAAKKKEAQNSVAKQKQQRLQLQLEEQYASSTKHFTQNVLPNWDNMYNTRKTRDLWWLGLPSSIRGKVWRLAIGNDLNLSQQLYEICLSRAQNRLSSPEPPKSESDIDQESSMDVIQLDISRTFPNLCIFQEGGPYSDVLHSLLAAYVCYRPDVGYVQGMSYIAAILILNMEPFDAFVCFANLLNKPLHIAAFTLNQNQIQAYFNAYNQIFNYNLPKLFAHFDNSGLTPDLYLLDWIYTVFAKAMPLDVACRVWDLFLRDGEEFIFRTALGILHMNQEQLMKMDFLHGSQFLTRLPDDLSVDQLFKSIQTVSPNVGKQSFNQILDKCSSTMNES